MRDPEFIKLRNRFFLSVVVTVIFIIPVIILVLNKFSSSKSELLMNVSKEKSLIIYISDNSKKSKELEKALSNISYFKLNVGDDDFKEIMLRIEMNSEFAKAPGLIYVEKGKMSANIVDIDNENEIYLFIEKHNLKEG